MSLGTSQPDASNDDLDIDRIPARTTLQERTVASEIRPVELRRTVSDDRHDRARWGPIWTGAVIAVATYLLLELILMAVELLDRDGTAGADLPDGAWWSVLAAAVAVLVGGVVAGASVGSRSAGDGMLHGIGVWALTVVIMLVFAVIGTRLALGTLGYLIDRVSGDGAAQTTSGNDLTEPAGYAAVMLAATLVAGAIGGLIGSKMWPRARRDDALTFNDNDIHRSVQT